MNIIMTFWKAKKTSQAARKYSGGGRTDYYLVQNSTLYDEIRIK